MFTDRSRVCGNRRNGRGKYVCLKKRKSRKEENELTTTQEKYTFNK